MSIIIAKFLKGAYSKLYILLAFLIIGTALYSPFIHNNYTYDDFLFLSLMEENVPYDPLLGFWSAELKDFKIYDVMWWSDKDAEGTFFRPVPTLAVTTAYNIWGINSALPLHLFSVLLHCINAFLVFSVLHKLSKNKNVSLASGFIYLICVHHVLGVGWIATNTDLLAVLFMLLSILCYINYRDKNNKFNLILSFLFQLIAFGCKETASITTAAILLYEFIIIPDKRNFAVFFSNRKHWIGSIVLTICFLVFYKLEGFGINSLLYYDPFLNPALFIKNLFIGYPLMFLGLLSAAPFSFPVFLPELLIPFIIAGLILTAFLLISAYPFRKDKIIVFCFFLFIISILPQLSADATERQIYFPFTAGSYIIAFLIFRLPFIKKKTGNETESAGEPFPSLSRIGKLFSYYLLFSSVILTLMLMFTYPRSYSKSSLYPQEHVLKIKELADKKNASKIILLNLQSSMDLLYVNDIYRFYAGKYSDVNILYGGNGKLWFYKDNNEIFHLKTDKKGWLTNMFAKLPRTNPLIKNGQYFLCKDFSAEIIESTPDNNDALQVKFKFISPVISDTIFIYFDGMQLMELDYNSINPGEWIFLGDTSDVLKGLM